MGALGGGFFVVCGLLSAPGRSALENRIVVPAVLDLSLMNRSIPSSDELSSTPSHRISKMLLVKSIIICKTKMPTKRHRVLVDHRSPPPRSAIVPLAITAILFQSIRNNGLFNVPEQCFFP